MNIGLCLGGGGALGFAHVGVLKAFEENNIKISHISGASMGAIVGAIYANGYSATEIQGFIEKYKMYNIRNIVSFQKKRSGLSSQKKVQDMLHEVIPHNSFEQLKYKFFLSVVEIRGAQWEIISSGDNLIDYISASMAVPFIFEPETIGAKMYIDGGLMNNLPVEPLRDICDIVIAVDVQVPVNHELDLSVKNFAVRCYNIMQKQMQQERIKLCDHYITVPELELYNATDFNKYKELQELGYKAAVKYIQKMFID